jgi:hypothetical protein
VVVAVVSARTFVLAWLVLTVTFFLLYLVLW